MAYYSSKIELSYDYPASTVTRANGGFSKNDKEVKGRWVTIQSNGTVLLAADDGRLDGTIESLDATKVGVARGPICTGKQVIDTAVPRGSRVIGGERVVANGQTAERGFAKVVNPNSVAALRDSRGPVEGSGTNTADTEGDAILEVFMFT